MSDYEPIDCDRYSFLELAVMRGTRLRILWQPIGHPARIETLEPLDLITRARSEYLIGQSLDGERLELRLDRIRTCTPLDAPEF